MRKCCALLLLLATMLRADLRLSRREIRTPAPLPPGSLFIVGFLGAWEHWDNDKRSVRKVALDLRQRQIPGVYVETAGNHDRKTVRKFILEALDQNRNRRLDAAEKKRVEFICYGQSFGGAACVRLASELKNQGIPVRLTIQVDSIGRDDDWIPSNVSRALNLYQNDPGPIQGEGQIKAMDPARTTILGNVRFTYLFRTVDMSDYPWMSRHMGISHWKMDNDPVVWKSVEAAILAEIAAWSAGRAVAVVK